MAAIDEGRENSYGTDETTELGQKQAHYVKHFQRISEAQLPLKKPTNTRRLYSIKRYQQKTKALLR